MPARPPGPAVKLTWTASAGSPAPVYDVYRNGSLYTAGIAGTSYDNQANLIPGQNYSYFIRAHNTAGIRDSNTINIIAPADPSQQQADYPSATWIAGVPNGNYTPASRTAGDIRWIVIHTTESTADSAIQWFQNPASTVSAHYLVKRDGTVVQLVHDHDIAQHAGNWPYNQRSIGIEHERYAGSDPTPAQYLASSRLVQWLADHYAADVVFPTGIAPVDPASSLGVIGHVQVPDPGNPALGGGINHHTDPVNWNWAYYQSLFGITTAPGAITLSNDQPRLIGSGPAVKLNWTASSGTPTPVYDLYRNGSLYQSAIAGTSFDNTLGLTAGQGYTYFVRARNSAGYRDSGTLTITMPVQPSIESLSDLSISSSEVALAQEGAAQRVSAVVRNTGALAAANITVRFRDLTSGTVVSTQTIASLSSQGSQNVSALWTPSASGASIEIAADPLDVIRETSNGNNIATAVYSTAPSGTGRAPQIRGVKATYDGNTSLTTFGRFIQGIDLNNVFTADVVDPDGAGDIDHVTFNGGTALGTITDSNGQNGWTAAFNMALLNANTTIVVKAYDTAGNVSTSWQGTINAIPMPSWSDASKSSFDKADQTYALSGWAMDDWKYDFTAPPTIPVIGGRENSIKTGPLFHVTTNLGGKIIPTETEYLLGFDVTILGYTMPLNLDPGVSLDLPDNRPSWLPAGVGFDALSVNATYDNQLEISSITGGGSGSIDFSKIELPKLATTFFLNGIPLTAALTFEITFGVGFTLTFGMGSNGHWCRFRQPHLHTAPAFYETVMGGRPVEV